MIGWLVDDWKRDPLNFTLEFLGALCFIVLSRVSTAIYI